MNDAEETRWVRVASFLGLDGDVQADLLVTNLRGAGLAAVRLPVLPTTGLPMASWPMIRPALVFVPEAHEAGAREIVTEQPPTTVRPEVRTWFVAKLVCMIAMLVAGAWAFSSRVSGPGYSALLGFSTLAELVSMALLIRLCVALQHAGRRVWDPRVAAIAVLVSAVLALLAFPPVALQGVARSGADHAWGALLVALVYASVIVVLSRWLQGRRGYRG